MMDPKSVVVKSKSSNSGITNKPKDDRKSQGNKKSRSNADFPHCGLKKRGVYVEKRVAKVHLTNDKTEDTAPKKPPPRPPPGQKKFLTSVLTILSKSTAGTQYPEDTEENNNQKQNKTKILAKRNKNLNEHNVKNVRDSEKFKSRVLNKKFLKEDKKKMVVLQSKKEIAQTPSNYSEWSYKDPSHKSNTSSFLMNADSSKNNIKEGLNISEDLRNAIWEGRNVKSEKKLRYLDDEPQTLVSDGPKDQKKLYNFFVDLLETTISVYNVAADYNGTEPSDVSKTELQINESVADKLNINKAKDASIETIKLREGNNNPQNVSHNHSDADDEYNIIYGSVKPKSITIRRSRQDTLFNYPKVKKLKAASFLRSNKTKTLPEKSKSVEINRKTTFKNKNDLINVLKQQLEADTHISEEPQSLFQALRVMARNKKKKLTFDQKIITDECFLKRRKVIPSWKSKKPKNKPKNTPRPAKLIFKSPANKHDDKKILSDFPKVYSDSENIGSNHSLEVYEFDYDYKQSKTPISNKSKEVTFAYHSSDSEIDLDENEVILNPAHI